MESSTIMKILLLNMLLAFSFSVHADTALPPSPSPSHSPSPSSLPHDSSPPPLSVPEVSPPSPTRLPPPPAVDSPAPSASGDSTPPPLPVPEVCPPPPTTLPPPAAPLLPQPPPLPQFPPPEVDPIAPPPMSCKEQCFLKCADKKGLRRWFCIGKCLAVCKIISPSNHAGYQCTRDCVMNNLLQHQPDIKSIDGLVNTCYSNCTKNV